MVQPVIEGSFTVEKGRYHVDWLLRYRAELAQEALQRDCDAVLFVGPKLASRLPEGWRQGIRCDRPVFFLNFDRDPQANPWRDAITTIVKGLRGRVYTISRPMDLSAAWR